MVLEAMRVNEINWGVGIEEVQQIGLGELLYLKVGIGKDSKVD